MAKKRLIRKKLPDGTVVSETVDLSEGEEAALLASQSIVERKNAVLDAKKSLEDEVLSRSFADFPINSSNIQTLKSVVEVLKFIGGASVSKPEAVILISRLEYIDSKVSEFENPATPLSEILNYDVKTDVNLP